MKNLNSLTFVCETSGNRLADDSTAMYALLVYNFEELVEELALCMLYLMPHMEISNTNGLCIVRVKQIQCS